jgi:type III restriction enzyme
MKLHFEPDLEYQRCAIEAVCDVFRGQEVCRTEFTVTKDAVGSSFLPGLESDLGLGNRLSLLPEDILRNVNDVQLRNGLRKSEKLEAADFTVEMETGTGKTYVYLRTIFELNRRFGFLKFVIVVPSVAIKEGVYKTLQMTEDHFRGLYAGTPCEFFLYDSSKLGQVRNFATSAGIQVMVVTVGAINKQDVNNLYKDSEKTGGEKPIDLIRATHPVVVVDEPQSVDGGLKGAGKAALAAMSPLCTLRYSATHVDKHHMLYRLDAVDAYQQKLVKQIEVAAATVEGGHNKPFVRVVAPVIKGKNVVGARVELDVQGSNGVQRKVVAVEPGEDLEQTTRREIYRDFRIGEVRAANDDTWMELRYPGGEAFLTPGEAHGDVDAMEIQREMIRRTIREHLDKEKRLRPQGIKVLSLFFIDAVERYRQYDEDGDAVKGPYAVIFEEEYRRLAKHPDYRDLFQGVDLRAAAEDVHNGYFSLDRKKIGDRTVDVFRDTRGDTKADDSTYNLIMRDKERLLSFETPLKFIFSHSALREGWDSPNVFQICTLRDIQTERERRQTIGRGLRLCVNQDGERLRGFDANTLTVVATESYEEFADKLQKEIESDTGIRFGIAESHHFANVQVVSPDGRTAPLGYEQSKALWDALQDAGHITATGKVQESLREALKSGTLALPEPFQAQVAQVADILKKLAGRLEIRNADERRPVRPRRAVLDSAEFKGLWDRIKHKTTYRVQFDNEKLVKECIRAVEGAPTISKTRLQWRKADIEISKGGVQATETGGATTVVIDEGDIPLPDLLTDLQDRTHLTRRSIHRVLVESRRLDDFLRNPQQFIEVVAEAINRCKRLAIVDGIKYQQLGDQEFYAQELFEEKELSGYLRNMLIDAKKSVYEHVVYDSSVESSFAGVLERNDAIRVYAKLPGWFTIPTPVGPYNPDWAVLVQREDGDRLYFVVETKGGLFDADLRRVEQAKVDCGRQHFKALEAREGRALYEVSTSGEEFVARALER